eukprot:TRINITY_DN396_c0_g3_i2.p1 TRINITY_DN396_c0_g3~~TRINITY_DN396_c0_g3_i2.p1  ORF type:complete len:899 (-),score=258.19 TRINITY_DN396_c0_g3_i2:198-2894(-)
MDSKKFLGPKSNGSLLPSSRGLAPVPLPLGSRDRRNSYTPGLSPDSADDKPSSDLRKRSLDGPPLMPLPLRASPDKAQLSDIKPLGSPLDRSPAMVPSCALPPTPTLVSQSSSGSPLGSPVSNAGPLTTPFRSGSSTPPSNATSSLPSNLRGATSARRNSLAEDELTLTSEERMLRYRLERDSLRRVTDEQAEQIQQLADELRSHQAKLDDAVQSGKNYQSKFQAVQEALLLRDDGQAHQLTMLKTERDNFKRSMHQKEQQNQHLQQQMQQLHHDKQQLQTQLMQQQQQQSMQQQSRMIERPKKNPLGSVPSGTASFLALDQMGLVSVDSDQDLSSVFPDLMPASDPSAVTMESLSLQHNAMQRHLRAALGEMTRLKAQLRNRTMSGDSRRTGGAFQVVSPLAPINKVTLVFTDVEHSTAMWEIDSRLMSNCLALHNSVIRGAIAEFAGYEVKTEGDAFMIAFSEAINAINFCLTVQERLVVAEWPDEFDQFKDLAPVVKDEAGKILFSGMRVRMGAHCGLPICQEDPNTHRMDYFGRMVNKAARITGIAQAGQIIVSQTLLAEIEKAVVSRAVVKSLGARQLRGIKEDVEIVQLLPTNLAGRTFSAATEQDLIFANQSMSSQLDSLLTEHDELKRRFALLEERLQKLDVEAVEFAATLETLKANSEGTSKSPEELTVIERISQDFAALQLKQVDTSLLLLEINQSKTDFSTRITELSNHVERISAKEAEQEREAANQRGGGDQSSYSALSTNYGALSKRFKSLEAQFAEASAEKTNLIGKIKCLEEELEKLRLNSKKVLEAKHQVLTMKSLLQAKSSQIDVLKSENVVLTEELRLLRLAQLQQPTTIGSPAPVKNPIGSVSSQSGSFSFGRDPFAIKPGTPSSPTAADYLVINRIRQ